MATNAVAGCEGVLQVRQGLAVNRLQGPRVGALVKLVEMACG